MRITDVDVSHYRIPLARPMSDSIHPLIDGFDLILVRLQTDDGISGIGYAKSIVDGRSIGAVVQHVLAPLLRDADPLLIDDIWHRMYWRTYSLGRAGVTSLARAACDVALWDIKGKKMGLSLCRLLGGGPKPIPSYGGGVNLRFSTEDLVEEMQQYLDMGFRALKMKVGRQDWREDIRRVEAVRKAVGDEVELLTDANVRWTIPTAIQAAKAMDDYDIYWLEEPTHPDDVTGHRRIADATPLPLALGESLLSKWEFQRYFEAQAVHFPEPDVGQVGGITEWMKVAAMAQGNNLPVTSHGYDEIHVHLLSAIPNASFVEHHMSRLDEFIRDPIRLVDGCLETPDRPGHGVDFDWERLQLHRVV